MPEDLPIIAILGGTGKEGTGLALRWAAVGYSVLVGSRQETRANAAAENINHQLGQSNVFGFINQEAAQRAQVCILTVQYSAHQQALLSVQEALGGKILVDATSRVDYRDPRPPLPPSAAEEAQRLLGSAVRVVAAFQNVPASSLKKNLGQQINADVLVCSDDVSAAEQVIQLAKAAGMHGYYTGPLINANVVEGLTSVLISLNKYYGVKDARVQVVGIPD